MTRPVARLVIRAPMSGWLLPLADVPDAAFSGGMIGAGAAIDPLEGAVCAPCDGTVTSVAKAGHAATLRADNGAEILVHVGIDTVAAAGAGLAPRVKAGERVRAGAPLIDVDLDRLLEHATSLITPTVVVNASRFVVDTDRHTGPVQRGDPLFALSPLPSAASAGPAAVPDSDGAVDSSEEVTVALPHGLHARPAAEVVRVSRGFSSRLTLCANDRRAASLSMTALMALGAGHGDRVRIEAAGADARAAVRAIAAILVAPSIESAGAAHAADPAPTTGERRDRRAPDAAGELRGIVASPGLALGRARHLRRARVQVEERGEGVERERAALAGALRAAAASLAAQGGENDIMAAQIELLEDPALASAAEAAILGGKSAGFAWRQAVARARGAFAGSGDPRIAERVADLRDIEEQVLYALAGAEAGEGPDLPRDTILLADELLPSQVARLDPDRIAGLCCAAGGPTSHASLMAAARGIPALVGLGPALRAIEDGTSLLLDGERGVLVPDPGQPAIDSANASIARARKARAANLREAAREAVTADGARIEVLANLGSESEASEAVRLGAEGCGLLRTELLYLDRRTAPEEDEQAALYQAIARVLGDRPVVIRTLDVGGDKALPFLPMPSEDNPLLGLRGLRASLHFPRLLETQLRAILRIEPQSQCRVLLPMVTEPSEICAVRRTLDGLEKDRAGRLPLGAMIETPASVALADAIAREADFLSIGSNDLAQYTLAMDRTHPLLAGRFDYLHPAVLRQIATVCEAGSRASRSVSVCGALASEPVAVPVLVGLGVRTLSAVPAAVPVLKALIRRLTVRDCERLAARVLDQDDAASARRMALAYVPVSVRGAAS